MPHNTQRRKGIKVINLDDYRKDKRAGDRTIEIRLLPSGGIGYNTAGLQDTDALQALLGCYAVAGELLQTLREKMKCGTGSCGEPE